MLRFMGSQSRTRLSDRTELKSHNHCNTPMASKFTLSIYQSKPIYSNPLCGLPPFFTTTICLPPLLLQPFWPLHCFLNTPETFFLKPVYCCSFGFGCFSLASLHGSFSHFFQVFFLISFLAPSYLLDQIYSLFSKFSDIKQKHIFKSRAQSIY